METRGFSNPTDKNLPFLTIYILAIQRYNQNIYVPKAEKSDFLMKKIRKMLKFALRFDTLIWVVGHFIPLQEEV